MSDNYSRQSHQNRPNTNNPQMHAKRNINNNNQSAIPTGNDVQHIFEQNKGNFSLWFNKFTPIVINGRDKLYHTCNNNGNTSDAVNSYKEKYDSFTKNSGEKLELLHKNQQNYLLSFPEQDYEVIELKASTKTPLITGIGQTHPNEVSMVFDYMLGIPYIPASSIKGLLRFTTVIKEITDNIEKYNNVKEGKIDDESVAEIQYYFGGQSNEGSVVFLDAYPQNIPNLHIDIMNPHYGEYYQDAKPPADYLEPTPIKFLTVAPKTTFVFRAIINKHRKDYESLKQSIKKILEQALTKEGIGAKTALGYGLFEEISANDYSNLSDERKKREEEIKRKEEEKRLENMSEIDKKLNELSKLTNSDKDFINISLPIFNSIDSYSSDDKIKIAYALMEYWKRIGKWEGRNEKQVQKVRKIKDILGIK